MPSAPTAQLTRPPRATDADDDNDDVFRDVSTLSPPLPFRLATIQSMTTRPTKTDRLFRFDLFSLSVLSLSFGDDVYVFEINLNQRQKTERKN